MINMRRVIGSKMTRYTLFLADFIDRFLGVFDPFVKKKRRFLIQILMR